MAALEGSSVVKDAVALPGAGERTGSDLCVLAGCLVGVRQGEGHPDFWNAPPQFATV